MNKKYSFILLIIFTILTLNSCKLEDSFEKWSKADRDDVNIIHKIWAQSLNKAHKIYINSTTSAS